MSDKIKVFLLVALIFLVLSVVSSVSILGFILSTNTTVKQSLNSFLSNISISTTKNISSSATEDSLLKMREEEKLARDVYKFIDDKWNLNAFGNIIKSEQQHMDSVLSLLSSRGISDPVDGMSYGEFATSKYKDLYSQLTSQASKSVLDAYIVGATIEDLDIYDLQNDLKILNDSDIQVIYNKLINGSQNHMVAFNRQLTRLGYDYKPQYISQEEFDTIVLNVSSMMNFRKGKRV